jgi:hypothetical protein
LSINYDKNFLLAYSSSNSKTTTTTGEESISSLPSSVLSNFTSVVLSFMDAVAESSFPKDIVAAVNINRANANGLI